MVPALPASGHVVLLGDSIFDNALYVPDGSSVEKHLRSALPSGWQVTLLALDGAFADGVERQLARLPKDATHLIVSAGGNNALDLSYTIFREVRPSLAEALTQLAAIRDDFKHEYRTMLQGVLSHGRPTAICTIYDSIPGLTPPELAGLCLFNDVILRKAFEAGLPVIDLRLICNEPGDYAAVSPIEPSVAGGRKIARAIADVLMRADFASRNSEVFSRSSSGSQSCGGSTSGSIW